MAGIPPELYQKLRQFLLDCEQFESDRALQSIVSTYQPLIPWRFLPQANSIASRVNAVISYLQDKSRSDTKENALVLLLRLLKDLIEEEDQRHQQLVNLIIELENAFADNSSRDNLNPETKTETTIGGTKTGKIEEEKRQPIKKRWAFLVGVNRYNDPGVHNLKFCVKDVQNLEKKLKELGYTVMCLHDSLESDSGHFPIHNNIEAELINLCNMVDVDDLLLVHFACHGKLGRDEQPMLIVRDTRLSTIEKTGLSLADMKKYMHSSKARRLVLTLDACHMGVETGREIDDPQFIHNAYELAEGFALIAASTAQQKALESPEKNSGVFTYYLIEGLKGEADREKKGFVTVDDIKTYVLHSLRRWSIENDQVIQEPTAKTEGLGDMIVADYRYSHD